MKVKHLDLQLLHSWPTQSQLSKAVHRIRADELEQRLAAESPAAALWFALCRLRGSGAWLHALPVHARFRVSSDLYRIMLCLRMMVRIPATAMLQRCVCGYDGPFLPYGVHWFAQCRKVSLSSSRHNALCEVLREMLSQVQWEVQDGETANWIRRRNDLRPFDILARSAKSLAANKRGFDVGVADPTRVHLVPTGQHYFKKGKASSRLVSRKKSRFNYLVNHYGLKHPVDFEPLGYEVTGGMGYHAARLFTEVVACASVLGAGVPAGMSTWSAMDFGSFYSQAISFTIVKLTAMAVQHGIRQAMAEAHSSN